MAKLYGEIAASALLTLDKSFARALGQPLDSTEVYYSLTAAKEYAAGANAYVGQKIVVIENGIVTHYGIENAAGDLKELGSKPVADGTTISIGEDGKITLANIAEKKEGTYNAVLVDGVLTWVAPSATTVEGLSDLIEALTGRVDTAEDEIDALQEAVGVAAKEAVGEEGAEGYEPAVAATGLHKAIADEKARAEAAEKALGERIDAIDFVDDDELAAAREEISAEIDADVKVAKDRADEAYALAETKVDSETYATDKKAIEDEAAAIREIAEDAQSTIDTFLNSEEIDETVNNLKEIKAELDKMADATEMVNALALKADLSYVNEELGKKQDVIAENTYDAYGSAAAAEEAAKGHADSVAATAKSEAISEAATAAAELYATKTALGELETSVDGRLDTLEAINHELYATKEELEAHEEAAANTYATKEELKTTDDKAVSNANAITNLTGRLDGIVAQGGEPNVINNISVNGVIQTITDKTVNVEVPTAFSDLTDDSGFDARIAAAQTQADKGVEDAGKAATAAAQAQTEVDALEEVVGGHTTKITNLETSVQGHTDRILVLEADDVTIKGDIAALKTSVLANAEALGGKAAQADLLALTSKVGTNEATLTALTGTTIPGLETEIGKKADASSVYTIDQIDAIIGEKDADKSIVDLIDEAKSEATYDDAEVKGLIKANTDAIAILNGDVETEGSVAKAASDAAIAEVAKVVGSAPEALNTLEEVATWIANDETGAAAMANRITANEQAISAINHAETGILAQAKSYTDLAILGLPMASASDFGLAKVDDITIKATAGTIAVKAVSTDLLTQGTAELILDGGSAAGASKAN